MRWPAALFVLSTVACNAIVNFGELQRVPATLDEPPAEEEEPIVEGGAPKPPKEGGGAKPPGCDPTKPFGTPVLLPGPINAVSALESSPTLTDDELVIVFGRIVGSADTSLVMATRSSFDVEFGEPRAVPGLAATRTSHAPTMTGDGLVLFWSEQVIDTGGREPAILSAKILSARRSTRSADFGAPAPYRQNEDNGLKTSPFVTRDGSELYFSQFESPEVIHVYRSVRGEFNVYQPPERVNELASDDGSEGGIAMTDDGLRIYFASSRAGAEGANDVYTATRKDRASPWTNIERVPELSSPSSDRPGWLSPDGCRLYMGSERESGGGLFVATKPPK
ncbi:MAG: PD40 domain-containing protein [Labilithrix sp.]|nr:PD40 domain-containing protein [Labilithrix sp.]MCW5813661.1 PD40 domain-containing protein [Labilithrix sp.]